MILEYEIHFPNINEYGSLSGFKFIECYLVPPSTKYFIIIRFIIIVIRFIIIIIKFI